MISLEETMAVFLGAESEAKRLVQEAREEADAMVRKGQDDFMRERDMRISSARQRASAVLDNARNASQKEAEEIIRNGKARRERMLQAFEEHAQEVARAIAIEEAEAILSGRGRRW